MQYLASLYSVAMGRLNAFPCLSIDTRYLFHRHITSESTSTTPYEALPLPNLPNNKTSNSQEAHHSL